MKTTLRATLIIALFAASQIATAGTKTATASFQTTFVVNESCAVQTNHAQPVVSCQFNSPYLVTNSGAKTSSATAARTEAAQADIVTITF